MSDTTDRAPLPDADDFAFWSELARRDPERFEALRGRHAGQEVQDEPRSRTPCSASRRSGARGRRWWPCARSRPER